MNVKNIKDKFGIEKCAFNQRINKGLSPTKSIISAMKEKERRINRRNNLPKYLYSGKMLNAEEIAKLSNLPWNRNFQNILKLGVPLKKAIKLTKSRVGSHQPKYDIDGKMFGLRKITQDFGISRTTLKRRLAEGMEIKDAIKSAQEAKEYYALGLRPRSSRVFSKDRKNISIAKIKILV